MKVFNFHFHAAIERKFSLLDKANEMEINKQETI